tara:strand:- start:3171 stop:3599 length:429 start_codon:yes stop_codon:yes gene_type:complete
MAQTWTPAEKQMRQALCDRIKELDRLSFKPTCAEPATLSSLRTALMAMHSVHFCWDISAIDRHEFSHLENRTSSQHTIPIRKKQHDRKHTRREIQAKKAWQTKKDLPSTAPIVKHILKTDSRCGNGRRSKRSGKRVILSSSC